jgi:hypothetical protein
MRDKASKLSTALQIRFNGLDVAETVKTNLGCTKSVTTSATIKAEMDFLYPT